MSSRHYPERISIEIRGTGEWTELCRRRAAIDTQSLTISVLQDSALQNLDHRDTRVCWHRPGDTQVINLTGIFVNSGRRPELVMQGFSEQFDTQSEPTLVDLEGNEGVYAT
jgi:hypothetical protein